MPDFLEILLAALIGGVVSQFLTVRALSVQSRAERVDRLCALLEGATSLGVEYWCSPYEEGATSLAEARMLAQQNSVLRTIQTFEDDDWTLEEKCKVELHSFIDCFTGGDFSVVGRDVDVERAAKMYGASADLVDVLLNAKRHWFSSRPLF